MLGLQPEILKNIYREITNKLAGDNPPSSYWHCLSDDSKKALDALSWDDACTLLKTAAKPIDKTKPTYQAQAWTAIAVLVLGLSEKVKNLKNPSESNYPSKVQLENALEAITQVCYKLQTTSLQQATLHYKDFIKSYKIRCAYDLVIQQSQQAQRYLDKGIEPAALSYDQPSFLDANMADMIASLEPESAKNWQPPTEILAKNSASMFGSLARQRHTNRSCAYQTLWAMVANFGSAEINETTRTILKPILFASYVRSLRKTPLTKLDTLDLTEMIRTLKKDYSHNPSKPQGLPGQLEWQDLNAKKAYDETAQKFAEIIQLQKSAENAGHN